MPDGEDAEHLAQGGFMTARDVLEESESAQTRDNSPTPSGKATANRRVKTYRLQAEQWVDLGTGWCLICTEPAVGTAATAGADTLGPWIVVVPESSIPSSTRNGGGHSDDDDESEKSSQSREPKQKKRKIDKDDQDEANIEIWRSSVRTVTVLAAADGDRGGYQRQQDTLIVWTEADGTDMALSFANVAGCAEIWDFIEQVKSYLMDSIPTAEAIALDDDDDELFSSAVADHGMPGKAPPSSPPARPSPNNSTGLFRSSSNSGLNISPGTVGSAQIPGGLLPKPSLSNLDRVETALKHTSRTPSGRERLASWIVKTDYLSALTEVASEAEDLEDVDALHTLCMLVQAVLLLNDNTIFEYILSDQLFLKVVGTLEYDPDFHGMKANYRAHLSDPSRYREVVPIKDAGTLLKIHQTYRLQYLKDVILARIIDDPTFSMLNSFIFFHQVDIVQHLQQDQAFLAQLFAIFDSPAPIEEDKAATESKSVIGPVRPQESPEIGPQELPAAANGRMTPAESQDKQCGAILLLQQFCCFAKNLQIAHRNAFYRQMGERGLLRVLEQALAATSAEETSIKKSEETEQSMRIATIDILMMVIDHNPNGVRAHCLRQNIDKKQSLVIFLIRLLAKEKDLGIQAQMAEALKVLVQTGPETPSGIEFRTRNEDSETEKFLQYFYDHCMTPLFESIASLEEPSICPNGRITLSPSQQALCAHLCDLLCHFITVHSFRSKYFILSSSICEQVAYLFKTTQKHMTLAALRVFRATIARKDDFYNRYLIKNDLFLPVLEAAREETGKDNLLSSACLDFFEHIRVSNTKAVLNHIMDQHGDLVRSLTSDNQTLALLVMRWEQNNEPPPEPTNTNETLQRQSMERSTRTLEAEEESYFDDSSSEEESSQKPTAKRKVVTPPQNGRKRVNGTNTVGGKGMSRSPASVFQEMAVRGAQGKARAAKKPLTNGSAKLVDYDDDDDERESLALSPPVQSNGSAKTPIKVNQSEPPDRGKLQSTPNKNPESVLGSPYHSISTFEIDSDVPPSLKALGEKRRREEEEDDMLIGPNKRVKTQTKTASSLANGKRSNSLTNGLASKLKVNFGAILGSGKSEKA